MSSHLSINLPARFYINIFNYTVNHKLLLESVKGREHGNRYFIHKNEIMVGSLKVDKQYCKKNMFNGKGIFSKKFISQRSKSMVQGPRGT